MQKPNLILLVFDTLRADYLGCYGNKKIHTPNLDAFARESVIFENAYPESLPTIPARRAILTGRRAYPFRNYYLPRWCAIRLPGWQAISNTEATLAEDLIETGYYTGFVSDTSAYFTPGMNFTRGFLQWEFIRGLENSPYRSLSRVTPEVLARYGGDVKKIKQFYPKYFALNQAANLSGVYSEEDTTTAAVFLWPMRFVEENRPFQPFFLFLDSFAPHEPWKAPDSYLEMYEKNRAYEGRTILLPKYAPVTGQMNEAEFCHTVAHYSGLVSLIDTWFGYFVQKLKRLNLWKNSLIIVLSDHGTNLAENPEKIIGKPHYALYPAVMRVPFLVHLPGSEGGGKRLKHLIYNLDATATLYEAAGLKTRKTDGRSIYPCIKKSLSAGRPYLTCRYGDSVWFRDEKHWVIMDTKGQARAVFDILQDPLCRKNVAAKSAKVIQQAWKHILKDADGTLPDYQGLAEYTDAVGQKTEENPRKQI